MQRRRLLIFLALILAAGMGAAAASAAPAAPRPPAVPLVTHDPYFSIWAVRDKLTDDWPRHWTGTVHGLSALARIDGKPYRVMGPEPRNVPALPQTALEVTPTQTLYTFAGAGVELRLTFTSPLLIKDLDIMSRPATYVTASFRATDGGAHAVSFFFDAPAALAVNTPDQKVVWGRYRVPGLEVMGLGSKDQPVLEKKGDDLRIDWGRLYLAAPSSDVSASALAEAGACREAFAADGRLPAADDLEMPRPADDDTAAALVLDFGSVAGTASARHLILAYDDGFSIEYFYRKLRPYWRRTGWEARDLLAAAAKDYPSLFERCRAFDAGLAADMRKAGGEKLRVHGLARLPPIDRRPQARRRHRRHAALLPARELQQRLHLDGRRHLSRGAAVPPPQPGPRPGHARPGHGLREERRSGRSRSRPTTSARIPRPTARSTAAGTGPRRTRCRSRRAAT